MTAVSKTLQVVALVAFSFTAPAQEEPFFLEVDLQTLGDGLITYDGKTGLEWLDPRATNFVSYQQAKQSVYVTQMGFRHANRADIDLLLGHFGIAQVIGRTEHNYVQIGRMIDFMGPGYTSAGTVGVAGLYNPSTGAAIDAGWLSVDVGTSVLNGRVQITTDGFLDAFQAYTGTGNFLVREVEPGARLQQLRTLSTGVGSGKTLLNRATNAHTSYQSSCTALQSFVDQVTAWTGNRLSLTQAEALSANATMILSALTCE